MNSNSPYDSIYKFFVLSFLSIMLALPLEGQHIKKELYLATELNNVVCGYARIVVYDSIINQKKVEVLKQEVFINFYALGHEISQHQVFTYYIDFSSGNFIYHDSYHKQGDVIMSGAMYVEEDHIRISNPDAEDVTIKDLPVDLIVPNTQFYPYLQNDFVRGNLDAKCYTMFNVRTGKIEELCYSKTGEEKLELAGKLFEAVILTQADPSSGQHMKLWIDKGSGMRLKTEYPNQLTMYLADASVTGKIKTGNWDALFFTETNVSIQDIRSISHMKVKATLQPSPPASLSDLNVPGQTFTGKADENGVEGIFEIKHRKYDGRDAPAFPFNATNYTDLGPYLAEAERIESNDPVLMALARDISSGSENLWEAATRISYWVAMHIEGSILDGTARETYDASSGLCGAQSNLVTALCRAAGIPARCVWGCLYTTEYGGSFGHHAWNEIFMGEDGWIPLDATIHETDYVDSGHIRLGVLVTRQTHINSWEMEILDFRL